MQHRDSIRDSMASAEFILPEEFITETLNVNQNQKSNSVTTANSADSNNIMFRNMIQHLIKPDSNDVYEKTDPKTSADKSLQDLLEQSKQAETNAVKCVTTANSVDSNSIMFRNMIQHLIKPDSVDVYEKTDPKTAADKSLQDLLEQSKQAETNAVKCEHNIFIEFFHDDQMDTLYKERIKEFIATVNNMDLPFLRKKKRKLSKKIRKASKKRK
ncbi:hypothetical protein O3M35_009724 [Rhynocoris fuscipes]|uniref:Uncharacterized protein n=1 Tax=Rhynocoris fuscipes TaxID=488301 RepID=A0AAW1D9W3_9HEMI